MRQGLFLLLSGFLSFFIFSCQKPASKPTIQASLKPKAQVVELPAPQIKPKEHPPHTVVTWTTKYKGRTFRVIKLPRCEHLETLITYQPAGETKEQAKKRLSGIASSTAGFYNPRTLKPVDFFRRNGQKIVGKEVGRCFLAIFPDGKLEIQDDYQLLHAYSEIDAVALGQRIVPFHHDGFSTYFANLTTERMALGFSRNRLYIVQGKSDLWQMGKFMEKVLYCQIAINTDGGHSVRGKSPFHLVFKWKPIQTN